MEGQLCMPARILACGATVDSAQMVSLFLSQTRSCTETLSQTLAGVRSVLEPQGAKLIGGHTPARSPATSPLSRAFN